MSNSDFCICTKCGCVFVMQKRRKKIVGKIKNKDIVIGIDEAQQYAKESNHMKCLLRKIQRKCHICGKQPRYHFCGTKNHYYACEKHIKIISKLDCEIEKNNLELME